MTILGKVLFSLLLLGMGFGLASWLGPPELGDQLADRLGPRAAAPAWGQLAPRSTAPDALPTSDWSYFARTQTDQLGPPSNDLRPVSPWPPESPAGGASPWETTPSRSIAEGQPPKLDIGGGFSWEAPTVVEATPNLPASIRDAAVRPAATGAGAWQSGQSYAAASEPVASAPWPDVAPAAVAEPQPIAFNGGVSATRGAPPIGAWQHAVRQQALRSQNHDHLSSYATPDFAAGTEADLASVGSREPRPETHIVTDGDTLAGLAERYLGDASRAAELFAWNRAVLSQPDLLPIGAELRLGGPAAATFEDSPFGAAPRETFSQPGRQLGPVEADLAPVRSPSPYAAGTGTPRARLQSPRPAGYASVYSGR